MSKPLPPKKVSVDKSVMGNPLPHKDAPIVREEPPPSVIPQEAPPVKRTIPPLDKITDSHGVVWSLGPPAVPGGFTVLKDGAPFVGGGTQLALVSGELYLGNSGGAWFILSKDADAWIPSEADPATM